MTCLKEFSTNYIDYLAGNFLFIPSCSLHHQFLIKSFINITNVRLYTGSKAMNVSFFFCIVPIDRLNTI